MKIRVENKDKKKKLEEGLFDFFKRNKDVGPKKSGSAIPSVGQFTQKKSNPSIPQKGQFGDKKRKPSYGPKHDAISKMSSWNQMEQENSQVARNMLYRIAPFVEIYPKNAKDFVQNGGMEYKIAKDRVMGLYNKRTDLGSVDFFSYVMALSNAIGENERKMLMNPEYRDKGVLQTQINLAHRLDSLQTDRQSDIKKSKEKKGVEFGDYDFGQMAADKEKVGKGQSFEDYLKSLKEEKPCWDGYEQVGMKIKFGKKVPNCVPQNEEYDLNEGEYPEFVKKLKERMLEEAEYQGKKVTLNKPIRTPEGPKKFKVYVKDGDKVKMVRFGDPNMKIKKSNPERRKSFRARHNCDNPGPKTKARYWSCRNW